MVLQIFVTPECSGCEEAARLAALLRRELPGLEVELHILTVAGVVATPAYLLDGRPIRHRRRCAALAVAELPRRLRSRR